MNRNFVCADLRALNVTFC